MSVSDTAALNRVRWLRRDDGEEYQTDPETADMLEDILKERRQLNRSIALLTKALEPMQRIADAYDANNLDDEARKVWGPNDEFTNTRDPSTIDLYTGRGGRQLLTLADCLEARDVLRRTQ